MKALSNLFSRTWRIIVLIICFGVLFYVLYFHNLGNLLPGYSKQEISSLAAASNWHSIASNPVNAPYTIPVWLLVAVLHHGILVTRIVAALYATFGVLLFFLVSRYRFGFWQSFVGATLFATSAGFLHVARLGSPQILTTAFIAFLAMLLLYRRQVQQRSWLGYLFALVAALLWYIPGMLWFEVLSVGLLFQSVRRIMRQTSSIHIAGYSLVFLITLLPLIIAGAHTSHVLLQSAGLPTDGTALKHFGTNIVHGLLAIGFKGQGNPLLWVGHAPLLDVVELALFILGLYYSLYRERSRRTVYLASAVVLSLILTGFSPTSGFTTLIPIAYLFVLSGLNQLLIQWFVVFPRNPVAKFTGVGVVGVMLFFSVLYQVRSYFVAWPHNQSVRATFDRQHK
jgi:hypothetical protein